MSRRRLQVSVIVVASLFCSPGGRAQQWKTGGITLPPPSQNVQPATAAAASAATTSSAAAKQLDVRASSTWTDSGIDVVPGDKVTITTEGALTILGASVTADGMTRSWNDVIRSLPVNSAGTGALIARVGNDPAVVPFLIGAKKEFTVNRPGRLFLGVNRGSNESFDGTFKTSIQIARADKTAAAKVAECKFDNALFEKIPRRVTDQAGGIGDMVNFVMVGPEASVKDAFASGGWVLVDRTKEEAALHAVLATIQKQTYLEMPMSELYLFGRPQDYGFARAEPLAVVQERHHLRVWKAPFQYDGQDVWVGAATHDIGFEKDQRNNGVTHKIDPNVDTEREFVRSSLTEGGGVVADTYVLPKDPVQDAKTATGGSFHSDGRVLILQLRAASTSTDAAAR